MLAVDCTFARCYLLSMQRTLTFFLRMDAEEKVRLDMLSKHYGLSASSLVRMLLKKEEQTLAGSVGHVAQARKTQKDKKRKS
jgi:hypothetical protein